MDVKIIKEFQEACLKELGFVSSIFMSQGDTKAKHIIMPSKELVESAERLELHLFKALSSQKKEIIDSVNQL